MIKRDLCKVYKKGFTMAELMAVVVLISLLASLAVFSYKKVAADAEKDSLKLYLKEVGAAYERSMLIYPRLRYSGLLVKTDPALPIQPGQITPSAYCFTAADFISRGFVIKRPTNGYAVYLCPMDGSCQAASGTCCVPGEVNISVCSLGLAAAGSDEGKVLKYNRVTNEVY